MHPVPLQALILLACLIVLAIAALVVSRRHRPRALSSALERPWPLQRKPYLLSEPERLLYGRLVRAAPNHIVLSQVQLLQMVVFAPAAAQRQAVRNRINQLSIDFVIVAPDTSIVAAIELDDPTHLRKHRRAADARKTHALESAGIPLLRWNVRQMPSVRSIEANLALLAQGAGPRLERARP